MLYECENVNVYLIGTNCATDAAMSVEIVASDDFILDQPFPLPTQSRLNEVVEYVRGCDAGLCDRGNVSYSMDFTMVREFQPGFVNTLPLNVEAIREALWKLRELEGMTVNELLIFYGGGLTVSYDAVLESAEGVHSDVLENARQWGVAYSLTLANMTIF